MVAEEGDGSHLVLQRIVGNRLPSQEAIKPRRGVISDIGDDQLLSPDSVDHDPAIAADAVGPDMLELLPADAAGGTAAFEQTLPVQNQGFRPISQGQRNQEKAEAEAHPRYPVVGARG